MLTAWWARRCRRAGVRDRIGGVSSSGHQNRKRKRPALRPIAMDTRPFAYARVLIAAAAAAAGGFNEPRQFV